MDDVTFSIKKSPWLMRYHFQFQGPVWPLFGLIKPEPSQRSSLNRGWVHSKFNLIGAVNDLEWAWIRMVHHIGFNGLGIPSFNGLDSIQCLKISKFRICFRQISRNTMSREFSFLSPDPLSRGSL